MMFVGVSKFGKTNLIIVDPRVSDSTYCRDMLLTEQLLLVMREISDEFFIFQQDSAPAHRACETLAFWNGRHPLSFHQTCDSQQSRSEPG